MPSVPANHGWIPVEDARMRLQNAGYRVVRRPGRLCCTHGIGLTTCFPQYLSIVDGKCSPRTVDRMVKKMIS